MQATMLLCDWAEQVNGKLYVMGGGWSLAAAGRPIGIALAIHLAIPWDRTNVPHEVSLRLLTEDGQPVRDDADNPIVMDGKVEVDRSPGSTPGTPVDAAMAVRIPQIVLAPQGYRWELQVGGDVVGGVSFRAVEVE